MDDEDVQYETVSEKEGDELTVKDIQAQLREKLKACESQKQEYLEGWQRLKADFVNARKNHERERQELITHATQGVIEDMIEILDTFDMAFAHKASWEKVDRNWRVGVESIYAKLLGTLSGHGLAELPVKQGERFDPTRHQSVESIPTDEKKHDDTVAEVTHKGYQIGEKIIRPAKVKILHYTEAEGSSSS